MPKSVKHLSDVMRTVRKKSVVARVNASVAIARTWREFGIEITDEQLIAIQNLNSRVKPQTIVREWQRQHRADSLPSFILGNGRTKVSHDLPLISTFDEGAIKPPRKKLFGLF